MQLRGQVEREKHEKESLSRQLKDTRDDTRRRIDTLERRSQALESDNTAMSNQLRSGENQKAKLSELQDMLRAAESDKKSLETSLKDTEARLDKIQDGKIESERRNEQLKREIDMLEQDKTFLSRENTSHED